MAISFECDSCGRHYTVSDSLAGKTARCKDCGEEFRVPGGPRPKLSSNPAPAPAPRPKPKEARFVTDDVPPPRSLYEIEDEPILPKRAPVSWTPRERSSRSRSREEFDPITKLNMTGVALYGGSFVLMVWYGLSLPAAPRGQPVEANLITVSLGLISLVGFLLMALAVAIGLFRLVLFGESPESGVIGWLAWGLSILLIGTFVVVLVIFGPDIYRRSREARDQRAAGQARPDPGPPQGFGTPPGAFNPANNPPQGVAPGDPGPQPGISPSDVRVALSDGRISRRTSPMGTPQPGFEFQVTYNVLSGRSMGERYVLMIRTGNSRGKLTTFHLQGSGTLSGFSPIASIDDGPFEAWMEAESFGGRNSRRVSDTIPLQVIQPTQATPGMNPPGRPSGIGQPPGTRPGFPGGIGPRPRMGPRGRP